MKNLTFSAAIDAPKKKVWDVMLNPETYKTWTGVAWPGSYYVGEWKEGVTAPVYNSGFRDALVEQGIVMVSAGQYV